MRTRAPSLRLNPCFVNSTVGVRATVRVGEEAASVLYRGLCRGPYLALSYSPFLESAVVLVFVTAIATRAADPATTPEHDPARALPLPFLFPVPVHHHHHHHTPHPPPQSNSHSHLHLQHLHSQPEPEPAHTSIPGGASSSVAQCWG